MILFYRIGNAVFLLKWVKEHLENKSINIYFFYDIACVLDTHLRVRFVSLYGNRDEGYVLICIHYICTNC